MARPTNTSMLYEHGNERIRGQFQYYRPVHVPIDGLPQMYFVATGGSSGAGTNSSLALMAALVVQRFEFLHFCEH